MYAVTRAPNVYVDWKDLAHGDFFLNDNQLYLKIGSDCCVAFEGSLAPALDSLNDFDTLHCFEPVDVEITITRPG
jgi:hypothetical protein